MDNNIMNTEIDLSKHSNRILYELATQLKSPDALEQIVNYAINTAGYNDYEQCLDEDNCYLDAVVKNPQTSLKAILSIIEYPKAAYARWAILEELSLDYSVIKHFAEFENDFSLICFMLRKYQLTNELADIIAKRLINNEIKITDVVDDDYDCKEEAFYRYMEKILGECSEKLAEKLSKWLNENSWLDKKFENTAFASRVDFLHSD